MSTKRKLVNDDDAPQPKHKARDAVSFSMKRHPVGTRLLYTYQSFEGGEFLHCEEARVKEWTPCGKFVRLYEPSQKKHRWIHIAGSFNMKIVFVFPREQ